MTKPKQVQKNLSENTGKNFFRNYALFYMQWVGIFTEITVNTVNSINSVNGVNSVHSVEAVYSAVLSPYLMVSFEHEGNEKVCCNLEHEYMMKKSAVRTSCFLFCIRISLSI